MSLYQLTFHNCEHLTPTSKAQFGGNLFIEYTLSTNPVNKPKNCMKRYFALERVFLIIIFVVNFNIIICYNLYGIHVEEQLSFQQMKNAGDCVFV